MNKQQSKQPGAMLDTGHWTRAGTKLPSSITTENKHFSIRSGGDVLVFQNEKHNVYFKVHVHAESS